MFELALIASLNSAQIEEKVNRTCAYIVGIPYASDNFNDSEWERFKLCRELINDSLTH